MLSATQYFCASYIEFKVLPHPFLKSSLFLCKVPVFTCTVEKKASKLINLHVCKQTTLFHLHVCKQVIQIQQREQVSLGKHIFFLL